MPPAPLPPDEESRLQALRSLSILDTVEEERFDRVTRLAARLLDVPTVLVSLIDADRQWFKSRVGYAQDESPRSTSFCAHAILGEGPLVVSDAREDARFQDNPAVAGPQGVRSYLGVPLRGPQGHALGTLCAFSSESREFTSDDAALLVELAAWVEQEIRDTELNRAVRRLQESEERYRDLVESASDLIQVTGPDGGLHFANRAWRRRLGYPDPTGMPLARFLEPEGLAAFDRAAAGEPVDVLQATFRTAGGEPVLVEGRLTVRHEAGRVEAVRGIFRDLSEDRVRQEEIDRFFHLSLDLIAISGPDGTFRQLNPVWERVTGWSREELKARPILEFLHPEDREFSDQQRRLLREGGEVVGVENRFRCKDGHYVWLRWRAQADPARTLVFAVAQDVTEARAVERMKDEFIAIVSHELRTPLTSIRGSLGLLGGGALGELSGRAQRLIDIALTNTDRLVRLVGDILDLERMQSGNAVLDRRAVPVEELLVVAEDVVRRLAEERALRLEVLPCPGDVWADPDRIVQVLTNLVGNAVKFSPPDSTILVTAEREGGGVRFAVRDQGRGIPADRLASIFERFVQVDASDARDRGGTGLGLPISRSIVEQHGGRIGVESVVGEGSTFWFTLPAGKP